jgi:hypothetical protein
MPEGTRGYMSKRDANFANARAIKHLREPL